MAGAWPAPGMIPKAYSLTRTAISFSVVRPPKVSR